MNQIQDDEIDLFELFATLWDGKWLITFCVALATFIGFGYSQVAQPEYKVSASLRVDLYSVLSHQICESDNQSNRRALDCVADGTLDYFIQNLDGGWSLSENRDAVTYTTSSPYSVNAYEDVLSKALMPTNEALKSEAKSELASIESLSNDNVVATERVATNMLNANRVVVSIDNGKNAISLGPVSIVKTAPKETLIIALSLVLGGFLGAGYVLIRAAIQNRKERLANA